MRNFRPWKNDRGLSAMEMMVALGLLGIVIAAGSSFFTHQSNSEQNLVQKNETIQLEQQLISVFNDPSNCICQFQVTGATTINLSPTQLSSACNASTPSVQAGQTLAQVGKTVFPSQTNPPTKTVVASMSYDALTAGAQTNTYTTYSSTVHIAFQPRQDANGKYTPLRELAIPVSLSIDPSTSKIASCGLGGSTVVGTGDVNSIAMWQTSTGTSSTTKLSKSIVYQSADAFGNQALAVSPTTPGYVPAATVDINGDLQAVAVTYTSDKRLKTDIQPLQAALDKILTLSPVTFHWNELAEKVRGLHDQNEHMGLLAQDVEAVFPESVRTAGDGFKAVDYPSLVAPLVGAVKDLNAEHQALGAEQKQLEKRLSQIEQELQKK